MENGILIFSKIKTMQLQEHIMVHGIRHHSLDPPSFFKGGGANFNYLPWSEESEKLEKLGWKYGGGAGELTLFLFNFFKVYHFYT